MATRKWKRKVKLIKKYRKWTPRKEEVQLKKSLTSALKNKRRSSDRVIKEVNSRHARKGREKQERQ